jgi:RNA polymerase sigma-32 factor
LSLAISNAFREGHLNHYLREIHTFPMLSHEEEAGLAREWRERQDPAAAYRLVTSHLRLAAKIALGYRGYGLPLGDLIGEANVGLNQAVRRFNPELGFRFATYAMWWIRAAINEYVLHNWSLVKIGTTTAQKKLFFNLRRLKGLMHAIDDHVLLPEQVTAIARTLDVPEQDVTSMNHRLSGPDYSLNIRSGDGTQIQWEDSLEDEHANPEQAFAEQEEVEVRLALLATALMTLKERERQILTERRLRDEPQTLAVLAKRFSVSRERIRQIEERAFAKVQNAMRPRIARQGLRSIAADSSLELRQAAGP